MKPTAFALLALGVLAISAPAFAEEPTPASPLPTFALQAPAPKLALDPTMLRLGATAPSLRERTTHPVFHLQLAVAASEGVTAERTTIFGLPLNMGPGDRIIRGVVAAALIGVATWGLVSGGMADWASGVVYGVSAIPALTAATGYCPLYQLFGLKYSF